MKARKALYLSLGIVTASFFSWLIVRQVKFEELKFTFFNAIPSWLFVGLLFFVIGYICRIERWKLMLKRDNDNIQWMDCSGPLLASFAMNNILPFRAGDIIRSFVFNKQLGVSSGVVVATLFVERLLDLLMILIFLVAALFILGADVSRFSNIGGYTLTFASIAIMLLLFFPQSFASVLLTTSQIASRISPSFGKKLQLEIERSLSTLTHLANMVVMLKLIFWSFLAWFFEGSLYWFCALSLPSLIAPEASWLAFPIANLSTLIPSTPGYVGTFDYFAINSMTILGNDITSAIAYALLLHVLIWFPPTIIGGIYLLFHTKMVQHKITNKNNHSPPSGNAL